MWEGIALLTLVILVGGACLAAGLRIMAGELKVAKTENEILKAAKGQAGKAAGATGEVLKKVRERQKYSGPLDRADVERLFGGRGPEADSPGRSPAGPGGGTPKA